MMFEPLVALLEKSIPSLKAGVTLFINQMPLETRLGLLLKEGFAGTEIDGEIPSLRRARFQLAARGQNYADVKALVEESIVVLTLTGVMLEGMQVKSIRPLTEPIPYQASIGNYVEFSVNFLAIYGIVA